MFVPEGWWEAGPGEAIVVPILAVLDGLRAAGRYRFENEGVEKDLDQVIINMNRLKTEWHIIMKYEVGRKKEGRKANHKPAGNGNARHDGR